jgi:hypothetical protein
MASLRSSFSRMVEERLDGRDKVTHLERLALKGIEPGIRNLPTVRGHHRRGHRHDWNFSRGVLGSQPSERLDPVDPGKPNVHQDQARMSLLGEADALFPRLGRWRAKPRLDRSGCRRQRFATAPAKLLAALVQETARRTRRSERQPALAAEAASLTVLRAAPRTDHQRSSPISFSICSSQNRMSISRYIVVAVARCSCACSRLPVRR